MAPLVCLTDRGRIEATLRQDTFNNLYALGDLDDFFWEYTRWYAWLEAGEIQQLALLYHGLQPPVLLAFVNQGDLEAGRALLQSLLTLLPSQFYAHLSPGLAETLSAKYTRQDYGAHDKMGLIDPAPLAGLDTSAAVRLSPNDAADLEALYRQSYPENCFDARMLHTGQYYGIRQEDGALISAAGVHVYSQRYRVAALGNIVTHPSQRGKGLCQIVTAKLCQALLSHIDHIGLNVRADNRPAIACYTRLGFRKLGSYEEYLFTAKRSNGCEP